MRVASTGRESTHPDFRKMKVEPRQNILMVTPDLPFPPYGSGMKVRAWPQVIALCEKYNVDLLSYSHGEGTEYKVELERVFRRVFLVQRPQNGFFDKLLFFPRVTPEKLLLYTSLYFDESCRTLLTNKDYGLVYVVSVSMAHLALPQNLAYPILVDICDAPSKLIYDHYTTETNLLKRLYRYADFLKMRHYEKARLPRKARYLVATLQDKAYLDKVCSEGNKGLLPIRVLPNSVDLDRFRPREQKDEGSILFLGGMSYWPNEEAAHWLASDIFPRIKGMVPGCRLVIAGRNPSSRLMSMDGIEEVRVTGYVEDTRDYYGSATVFLCPLRHGTGIKNKILEAMSMKLPVVGTRASFNGIPVQHGKEVLIADDAKGLAQFTVDLLQDRNRREHMAGEAYAFVRRYGMDFVKAQFLRFVEEALDCPNAISD